METKVFTQFRAPVNSYPLGEMNLGVLSPGRYSGFDLMTGVSLSIKLGHSGRIKKSTVSTSGVINEITFGALFMPNGCTIQSENQIVDDGIDFVIDSNVGNDNDRYDLLVCEHEYVQIEPGIPPLFFVQKGANDGLVPALAIPKKQIIIGIIKITANGNSFGELTYTKSPVPIPGDNTIPEFIESIGIETLLNAIGIERVITNNPILSEGDNLILLENGVTFGVEPEPAAASGEFGFFGVANGNNIPEVDPNIVKAFFGKFNGTLNKVTRFLFTKGSTVFTDQINEKGIQYGANYRTNFVARSLVDKEYVDTNTFLPGDIKLMKVTLAYVFDKFDMDPGPTMGLGIVGGEREGWALCNGNNDTDDMNGQIYIGWGSDYGIDDFGGSKDATVVSHSHLNGVANGQDDLFVYGGSTVDLPGFATSGIDEFGETITHQGITSTAGSSGTGKNMQPFRVAFYIQKQ